MKEIFNTFCYNDKGDTMKKALIIGSTVCDIIIHVHNYPPISGDENIIHQHMQLGGCAYNVAHILQECDIPFDLFSPVGKGIYGQFVKEQLMNHHIPILLESQDNNGCCYCIVDDSSERTFICEHGTEYFYEENYFNILNMDDYDCIYVCGLEIEEKSGDMIIDFLERNNDKILYFAPSPRINHIVKEKMQRIMKMHPIMHLNKQEILSFTQEDDFHQALISLYHLTHNSIIVTLGKEGCYYYDNQESFMVSSIPQKIESGVGAGDSHIGGIISYQKLGFSWYDTLAYANQIAVKKLSQKAL